MSPVFRHLVVLLIALVLVAPGSAFSRVLYACSMSGEVSAGPCCCHKGKLAKAHAEDEAAPTRIERPDCCEAQGQPRATPVGSHGTAEVQVLAATSSAILPAVDPSDAASDALRPLSRTARGPPSSLPVYVTNCSLLI